MSAPPAACRALAPALARSYALAAVAAVGPRELESQLGRAGRQRDADKGH